jgi:hypothetical protein
MVGSSERSVRAECVLMQFFVAVLTPAPGAAKAGSLCSPWPDAAALAETASASTTAPAALAADMAV